MDVVQFRTPGLGDQTYLFVHEGQGILVDPQRDVDRFLAVASERDVQLRFVLETHLHNDYVSGGRAAADATGAELVLPASAAAAYRHRPAFHTEAIEGDAFTIRPLHTPGHTPEHTSYVVIVDGEPVAVFSGGSLLVGSVGRPDLLGMERAHTLGRLQHGSIRRLAALPREVALYPTHGQGSFCTASGTGQYTSTIGAEIDGSPMLGIDDPDEFAEHLLAARMPIPAFYKFMGPANTLGVPPMPPLGTPELTLADVAAGPEGQAVVDVRPRAAQAAGHLPGSLLVELSDDFGSWVGWLSDYGAPLVLVAEPGQDVTPAVTQLAQIGIDSVRGVVRVLDGAQLRTMELVDVPVAAARAEAGVQVLDVRMPNERVDVPMPGAVERFVADLFSAGIPAELDPSEAVLIVCGSGRRAVIAFGLLADAGYQASVLTGAGAAELVAARHTVSA
jgi:glyoxylase-like metal-dependent hydrolase (beta-lactamase superfamily II)/rhodanese-related sulfurtransferase